MRQANTSRCLASSSQAVSEDGVYANGQIVIQPLPEAIFGVSTERAVPLRRLDAVLTEEQLQEHCDKEMQKVIFNALTYSCIYKVEVGEMPGFSFASL